MEGGYVFLLCPVHCPGVIHLPGASQMAAASVARTVVVLKGTVHPIINLVILHYLLLHWSIFYSFEVYFAMLCFRYNLLQQ